MNPKTRIRTLDNTFNKTTQSIITSVTVVSVINTIRIQDHNSPFTAQLLISIKTSTLTHLNFSPQLFILQTRDQVFTTHPSLVFSVLIDFILQYLVNENSRKVGSIVDYDPINDNYGSIATGYRIDATPGAYYSGLLSN